MRKTLATLALCGMTLFNPLTATTEDIIRNPEIELVVNYETETPQSPIDYSTSRNELTSAEESTQIWNIIRDIQDNDITSYQELLDASENLSENQKLVLASRISSLLNRFNYDMNLQNSGTLSQDGFFSRLQDSLANNEQNPLGVCKQISTHIERTLNDLGIVSATVSGLSSNGIGHAYVIAKIEDGTAIVDSYRLLVADTKNIEKTLLAYQKERGTSTFQHLFFENAEFKYRLITRDGENFLDFIEYDESSESLRSPLINDVEPQSKLAITLNIEDYLTSFEHNLIGFFIKLGEIRGEVSSPLEKMYLTQVGFKRNFSILDFLNINPSLSFIFGSIEQDTQLENNQILGGSGNLIINTNFEKGFNLTSRIAGIGMFKGPTFHDFVFGEGISYTIPLENTQIQPYIVSQFSIFPNDLGTSELSFFSKLTAGISLNSNFDDSSFSLDSYYLWRIWEQGFGGELRLDTAGIGMDAKGEITFSSYDFAPNKYNISIGPHFNLGNLELKANYQRQETNYDGERQTQDSLNIQGSIRF